MCCRTPYAVVCLAALLWSAPPVAALADLAGDTSPGVLAPSHYPAGRERSALLAQIGDPATNEGDIANAVAKLLPYDLPPDPGVAIAAAYAQRPMKTAGDKALRAAAVTRLEAYGASARPAIPALLAVFVDAAAEPWVRLSSARAAVGADPHDATVAETLTAHLTDFYADSTQVELPRLLGLMGATARGALPLLEAQLGPQASYDDSGRRYASFLALGQIAQTRRGVRLALLARDLPRLERLPAADASSLLLELQAAGRGAGLCRPALAAAARRALPDYLQAAATATMARVEPGPNADVGQLLLTRAMQPIDRSDAAAPGIYGLTAADTGMVRPVLSALAAAARQPESRLPVLLSALWRIAPAVRANAAAAAEARAVLVKLLSLAADAPARASQTHLLACLAAVGPAPDAVPALLAALRGDNSASFAAAARAIGELGRAAPDEAVPLLLRGVDGTVRTAALNEDFGYGYVPVTTPRHEAIRALGLMGARAAAATPALERVASADTPPAARFGPDEQAEAQDALRKIRASGAGARK